MPRSMEVEDGEGRSNAGAEPAKAEGGPAKLDLVNAIPASPSAERAKKLDLVSAIPASPSGGVAMSPAIKRPAPLQETEGGELVLDLALPSPSGQASLPATPAPTSMPPLVEEPALPEPPQAPPTNVPSVKDGSGAAPNGTPGVSAPPAVSVPQWPPMSPYHSAPMWGYGVPQHPAMAPPPTWSPDVQQSSPFTGFRAGAAEFVPPGASPPWPPMVGGPVVVPPVLPVMPPSAPAVPATPNSASVEGQSPRSALLTLCGAWGALTANNVADTTAMRASLSANAVSRDKLMEYRFVGQEGPAPESIETFRTHPVQADGSLASADSPRKDGKRNRRRRR